MKLIYFVLLLSLAKANAMAETGIAVSGYILGPQDSITIRVLELDEFDPRVLGAVRIDEQGNITLPLAGRVHAAGQTTEQLETTVAARLSNVVNHPAVTVSVAEYRSHPVSVLGAVKSPGVYQVTSRKTLFEVLSLAGGLNPDASNRIKITRLASEGELPLPNVVTDTSGEFYVGELSVRDVMEAKRPDLNIDIRSNDVISVPKAELVYVVGSVHRSGGFPLNEKEHITVLQAVSLAEGLNPVNGANHSRILRQSAPGGERVEISVNVTDILAGRAKDVSLQANDILFVPNNAAKSASLRAIEAVIQTGTGLAIWGR